MRWSGLSAIRHPLSAIRYPFFLLDHIRDYGLLQQSVSGNLSVQHSP
jgi:hypothetical protein